MSAEHLQKTARPLSPHLQVYRLPMTANMSVLHRATGAALSVGTLMIVWWLLAAATGEQAYNTARDFAVSPIGQFMLLGWTVSLYYHLFNGIRHLIWDTGYLFTLKNAARAGYIVLAATLLFTAATWLCAYSF